jgi:hypothetical protein
MGAALLATNYVYVMWNRAALMEATMTSFLVAAWYCAVRAERTPAWGLAAAVAAWLAFFTKAAAAFFVAGLAMLAAAGLAETWVARAGAVEGWRSPAARASGLVLGGLLVAGAAAALFVVPAWTEYAFYNWQMSVVRKPEYSVKALADRVSWFPIVHDFFTRMWFITVVGTVTLVGWIGNLRRTTSAERLIIVWIGLGVIELFVHDVGNERRFLFLIPPLVVLTATVLGRDGRLWPAEAAAWPRRRLLWLLPVVVLGAYVVTGAILRLPSLYEVRPGVWRAFIAAMIVASLIWMSWPSVAGFLARAVIRPAAAWLLVALVMAGDLAQYWQWASQRTYRNYDASRALGARLPAGTLVHGKLANGLALENEIRPVFVGSGFGNYDDRLTRDDIRYLLTYIAPRPGYEGPVILDVLEAYPAHSILWTFAVAETTSGADRAALIDKHPPATDGAMAPDTAPAAPGASPTRRARADDSSRRGSAPLAAGPTARPR